MSAEIDSIQIGRTQLYQRDSGKSWESAIAKSPMAGPIAVHAEKLVGDQPADRFHHGGPDKAILVYASAHFDAWRREFPE